MDYQYSHFVMSSLQSVVTGISEDNLESTLFMYKSKLFMLVWYTMTIRSLYRHAPTGFQLCKLYKIPGQYIPYGDSDLIAVL